MEGAGMHKKIAMLIQRIIIESPYDDFQYAVIPNSSNGFWKVIITFENRGYAHTESLIRCIDNLGPVFGEKLEIDDNGKEVVIK